MDMEMDMDIPDLDELQWLEANSHFEEEEEEEQYVYVEEEEEEEEDKPSFQIPEPEPEPEPSTSTANKKRPRIPSDLEPDLDVIPNPAARARARARTQSVKDQLFNTSIRKTPSPSPPPPPESLISSHDDDDSDSDSDSLSRFASEIDGECLPVTAPSGVRVYAKLDDHSFGGPPKPKLKLPLSSYSTAGGGLISEPVSILLQKAEQDALFKAVRESSETHCNDTSLLPETSLVAAEELWVNKYAPKSFTELLSDEHTNREVLSWLKQWDPSVFGTDIRNTGDEVLSALRRYSSVPNKHSDLNFSTKSKGLRMTEKYMGNVANSEQDSSKARSIHGLQNKKPNGAPEHKILLLCGPPGLGKTTLAHVAAKHSGYHVVEINASDDRSSTTIEAKILDAVQMNSVFHGSKPKCLVIDEIDGALGEGKGAVDVILKMVAAERKSYPGSETSNVDELSRRKTSKNGCKLVSLSRPVICICNDLYAPSLRPLRLIAKVLLFTQPSVSRVVSRLKHICNKEGLRTNSFALAALAEYTECDIRSCLNTLQFLYKKKESLNLVALSSQVIGRKDMTRSIFDIWKEIFHKRKVKPRLNSDMGMTKTSGAQESLFSLVSNRGDYELICDGIHENFLQLHHRDPMMQKTVLCLDALGVADLLYLCVMRSHNMFLYVYQTPILITIQNLLSQVERPTIEWPKSFQRHRTMLMEKTEVFRSWKTKVVPNVSRHLSSNSFVEDTVSSLLHILSPADLRPGRNCWVVDKLSHSLAALCMHFLNPLHMTTTASVGVQQTGLSIIVPAALHLMSEKENKDLSQLVRTMVTYSLTYRHTKSDPSTSNTRQDVVVDASSLSFDPPIHNFVRFKDYTPEHCELKSAVKQVILHEVEKQKIFQESTGRDAHLAENHQREISLGKNEKDVLGSSKFHEAACIHSNFEKIKNTTQMEIHKPSLNKSLSNLDSVKGPADVKKINSTGNIKKPSIGSMNFFDRFKKLNHNGTQNVDNPSVKLATTVHRDTRPLLFKFNEGFTNAVKRPMRVHEFLR